MSEINFSSKAAYYEQNALVQKSASNTLLTLLNIKSNDNILDLGCGPGNITKEIATLTKNQVLGVDISEGMIKEALKSNKTGQNINYLVKNSEHLGFNEEFEVIYCNSAFQWFKNPQLVLKECFNALKHGGRIGIQAPATRNYCPNFVNAVNKISNNPITNVIFKNLNNPWFFLESSEEYSKLFEDCGFKVNYSKIITESKTFTPEQVYKNFQSGAENGYLNQAFYSVPLTYTYIETFRKLVMESFKEQVNENGMIDLKFNRIYLVANKT